MCLCVYPLCVEVSVYLLLAVLILNTIAFPISVFLSVYLSNSFLCRFVSLSLIMAIVLSLKFSPPQQFCLFVNSLYANSSQLFLYMVLLSVGLSLYLNHCASFFLCLPSPLSDSISLYIHIYLSHHRCVSASLT